MSSTQQRVLFLAPQPFFVWRGSPIRVAFDVRALAENGWEVDLLTLPIGEDRPFPGVRVLRVPKLPGLDHVPIGPSPAKLLYDVLILLWGLGLVVRRRYDVIHGVEDAGIIACSLAALGGAACVFEKHSDPKSHGAGKLRNLVLAAYSRVERLAILCSDAVIGTGRTLVTQVRTVRPLKPAYHIFDLPSSTVEPDDARAAGIRAGLLRAPGELLALYVGSFAVYQGIDLLFDAMADVFAKRGDLRLVVIGGSEAERALRRRWLAERGFEDRVTFAGFIAPDALPDHLRAADILLSPRTAGVNSPLKMLDYLKAGRAIVATDIAANRELVDEQTARLVEPTPAGFSAGVLALADAPALREALATRGRRLIDETYNLPEFRRRLALCYQTLHIPGRRTPRLLAAALVFGAAVYGLIRLVVPA